MKGGDDAQLAARRVYKSPCRHLVSSFLIQLIRDQPACPRTVCVRLIPPRYPALDDHGRHDNTTSTVDPHLPLRLFLARLNATRHPLHSLVTEVCTLLLSLPSSDPLLLLIGLTFLSTLFISSRRSKFQLLHRFARTLIPSAKLSSNRAAPEDRFSGSFDTSVPHTYASCNRSSLLLRISLIQ